MNITLEQARCLDAFARTGTWQAAGLALHRAHTAVLYALGQLESQVGVPLLDRRGYKLNETLRYVVGKGAKHSESAWAKRLPAMLRFLLTGK